MKITLKRDREEFDECTIVATKRKGFADCRHNGPVKMLKRLTLKHLMFPFLKSSSSKLQ